MRKGEGSLCCWLMVKWSYNGGGKRIRVTVISGTERRLLSWIFIV